MKKLWLVFVGLPLFAVAVERESAWVVQDRLLADLDGDSVVDTRDQCLGTAVGAIVDSVGCALPVRVGGDAVLDVLFAFDSAELMPKAMDDLSLFASALKRMEGKAIELSGHADARGDEAYNQGLSERRAQRVAEVLVAQFGVNPEQLRVVGYSEFQPRVLGQTPEAFAQNRRVEAALVDLNTFPQAQETLKTQLN